MSTLSIVMLSILYLMIGIVVNAFLDITQDELFVIAVVLIWPSFMLIAILSAIGNWILKISERIRDKKDEAWFKIQESYYRREKDG